MTTKKRVFISFDYDHDNDLKNAIVGQARMPDSPFEIADWSIKEASPNWRNEARQRIRSVHQVIVICGEHTNAAQGVSVEIALAREESKPYFLLWGRSDKTCQKPRGAGSDQMYRWTWDNLKILIDGGR